ncbi:MAG: hypothetical protein JWO96_585 [Candidatus Saccharibacteria bacterium]|nr:hypothetical protein [Candidatus Saccharibacteria bacterium]
MAVYVFLAWPRRNFNFARAMVILVQILSGVPNINISTVDKCLTLQSICSVLIMSLMSTYESSMKRAEQEPEFDYFAVQRPKKPKQEIGMYIAEHGFMVPLINSQTEWQQAYDDGVSMLRSEMPQDYDGLSGLLGTELVTIPDRSMSWSTLDEEIDPELYRKVRDGEVDPTEYMMNLRGYRNWSNEIERVQEIARRFGNVILDFSDVSASQWRRVPGTNVTVFGDPNVDGRYHFGVRPLHPTLGGYQAIGGYQFEKDEYHIPQEFRKHDQPFVASPFVEFYEQIRSLPAFDNTRNPVLELQQDADGNIHFLQLLKTPQKRNFIEPFDLPSSPDTVRLTNVRGITPEEGAELRLFIEPDYLTPGMEGQAIFCGLIKPLGLEVQLASQTAAFILHEAYVSFKDNHFDSSPMFRPPLAAGLEGCHNSPPAALEKVDELVDFVESGPRYSDAVSYVDIKVTSNGLEAAIESDWDIKIALYDEI